MKTLKKIINCLDSYIKKNFFNLQKTDISQGCEEVLGIHAFDDKKAEEMPVEEYVSCYKNTTRWQTL
ncbi:MAG: hypothetical protein K0B11_02545 [Mariniphaga sp.]|nr:hypothetical protein [Mariniphaga sp.]